MAAPARRRRVERRRFLAGLGEPTIAVSPLVAESFQFGWIAEGSECAVGGDSFFRFGNESGGEVGGKLSFVVAAFSKGEDVGAENEVGGASVLLALEFFH